MILKSISSFGKVPQPNKIIFYPNLGIPAPQAEDYSNPVTITDSSLRHPLKKTVSTNSISGLKGSLTDSTIPINTTPALSTYSDNSTGLKFDPTKQPHIPPINKMNIIVLIN